MSTVARVRPRVHAAFAHRLRRPLAVTGRTGAGKTALLRSVAAEREVEPISYPAAHLAEQVVEALRCDCYAAFRAALVTDPRPLVVEHLEDLRGKPRTRKELRRLLLARFADGGVTLLTLTAARGTARTRRWLDGWAEVVSLD